ncbi:MAG: hypothetical protein LBI91_01200 [Spirochaetaceae bacterium]|jgi:hypothetical protein|nr:hypothetical protein [Spirochaetaceae bacterium]
MAKVTVELPPVDSYLKRLGLEKHGPAQKLADSEIIRMSDPYVPSDTTYTRKSVFINSDAGSGKITYDAYYTNKEKTRTIWNDTRENIRWQDAPLRGPFWVFRMWAAGGRERLMRELNALVKKLAGGGQ